MNLFIILLKDIPKLKDIFQSKKDMMETATDVDISAITYVAKIKYTKRRNPTKTYISYACHYSDRTVTRKSNVFMEKFNEILRSYGLFVE